MTKKDLIKIIEKYYLNGLTEEVRFKVIDNQLKINFATILKDCIGEVTAPWQREDVELGVFDTTQLYKLVKICNDPLVIDVTERDGKALKLEIKDNQFDLSYNLSDLGLIKEGKLSADMPEPSIVLNLNQEFIDKFKKAHNALEKVEVFSIQPKIDKQKTKTLEFVIGLQERYANKITFSEPVDVYNEMVKTVFRVSNFREIISNAGNETIKMYVYPMGIMKLETIEENIKVNYYLVPQR